MERQIITTQQGVMLAGEYGVLFFIWRQNMNGLPTLQGPYLSPGFNAGRISQQAGVPFAIVDQMLYDQPVPKEDAMKVLAALSSQTGQDYTLSTVAVRLLDEERVHG